MLINNRYELLGNGPSFDWVQLGDIYRDYDTSTMVNDTSLMNPEGYNLYVEITLKKRVGSGVQRFIVGNNFGISTMRTSSVGGVLKYLATGQDQEI
jgi:hypothetical protein